MDFNPVVPFSNEHFRRISKYLHYQMTIAGTLILLVIIIAVIIADSVMNLVDGRHA